MTWSNMALADLFRNPPTEAGDVGLWLSLHTGAEPSNDNELDPSMHAGYARVRDRSGGRLGTRVGTAPLSSVEWLGTLGNPVARRTGLNSYYWPSFTNRAGAAWPAVLSVAMNAGPEAGIARNIVSYRLATVTLTQGWTLAAGASGLPPDNLRDYTVAKPSPFSSGGFYGNLNAGARMANAMVGYGRGAVSTRDTWLPGVVSNLLNTGGPPIVTGQPGRGANTPSDRAEQGRGVAQILFYLSLYGPAQLVETDGIPTGTMPNVPESTVSNLWPIMAVNQAGTHLENLNDLDLAVTGAVTPNGYWGLVDMTMWGGGAQSWSEIGVGSGKWYPNVRFARDQSPTFYGPIDTTAPSLATGEGVVPAGALRIAL